MFPYKPLSLLLLLALDFVHASLLSRNSGKATLQISRRINAAGVKNLAEKDRIRAQNLKQLSHLSVTTGSINLTNADVGYTAEVGIGTPPNDYSLLIDTGSDITSVIVDYIPTSSSMDTGDPCSSSESTSGVEWLDTVTLSPNLVVGSQPICVSTGSASGIDGILGLAPLNSANTWPTVVDSLYTEGKISQEMIGILLAPASAPEGSGEMTFGGYDSSVITSSVAYVPLTTTSPASYYWGIDQSISYGATTILSSTAGIVDTGTTLILIASNAYQAYQTATGATYDSTTGLLTVTADQYDNLQTLTFNVGDTAYELTPNGQIWPRSLNTYIGGSADAIYLIVNDLGTPSGEGLDFINGYTFLERFYSVLDSTNGQVGFATTQYTYSTSN